MSCEDDAVYGVAENNLKKKKKKRKCKKLIT
jgi:hypothetical protein